jgi:ABC-2 type transport system ATP-binding protein
LQIQGDATRFRDGLLLEGVKLLQDNAQGEWRVAVPAGFATRTFFALAENHGVILRGIQPDDETLEELFLRTVSSETELHGKK